AVAGLILVGDGTAFLLVRLAGIASAAVVMPVSLALAATSYSGAARATAIGIAYAGYGLGQALSPMLVSLIPGFPQPAFIGSIIACSIALYVVRGRIPDLQHPSRAERPYVLGTAFWAGAVMLLTTAVLWVGGGWDNPERLGFIAVGLVLLVAFFLWERRRRHLGPGAVKIDRRPVTIALFVGVVIALAQTVPMVLLPVYFNVVLKYGSVFGVVAIAPLFAALVLAGPIAGYLLARFQPRQLIAGGVLFIGLGDLATAALLGPSTWYAAFIIPLILVGGGFVVATTVRTAIIFASVPRGLPATAGALNEASIEVGTRFGTVVVTALLAEVAVASLISSMAGQAQGRIDTSVATFRELLTALGMSSMSGLAASVSPADMAAYRDAYLAGVQLAFAAGGVLALLGAAVVWFSLGRRNPLGTVYEHREEREAGAAPGR
ncbi:MAG: MFS transporter, partial [Chloroflexota bacterium]